MERNIKVIRDTDGNSIVVINDIKFKGKRSVNWDDIKRYLRKFVGEVYQAGIFVKTMRRNIIVMRSMGGIVMIQDLRFRCVTIRESLSDIMFFMRHF